MKVSLLGLIAILIGIASGITVARMRLNDAGDDYRRLVLRPLERDAAPIVTAFPRVETPNGTEIRFGVMDLGDTMSHAFRFQNVGNGPLTLEVVETTCKCTVGELKEDSILPGNETDVTLTWEPVEYARDFRQEATIHTNDPDRRVIVLSIVGTVMPSVMASPESLVVQNLRVGQTGETTGRIFSYQSQELKVKDHHWLVSETAKSFEAEFHELDAETLASEKHATAGVGFTVKILDGLPLGSFHQKLRVDLVADSQTSLDIPINGTLVGDISIAGAGFISHRNLLRLGPISQNSGKKTRLLFLIKGPHRETTQLSIKSVEPDDILQVNLSEPSARNEGAVYLIKCDLEIPQGSRFANYLGTSSQHPYAQIVLATTHPDVPEIKIQVAFAIIE